MRKKNVIRIVLATALLLMIPLAAKLFTDEMDWDLADFVIAGALLLGTGFAYEFMASRSGTVAYRAAAGIAVFAALFLVWINLAVGLIGNENNPANLMYFGVLAIGLVGAFIARFKPSGMMRALFATAAAQALVPVIAFIIWKPEVNSGMLGVLVLNAFFIALWAGSAMLFRRASMAASK